MRYPSPHRVTSRTLRSSARFAGRPPLKIEFLEERIVPTLTFQVPPLDTATGLVMNTVQVHSDAAASVPISLSLNEQSTSGTPLLSGTVTQTTDAGGNATFNNLVIFGGTGKNCTLTALSGNDVAVSSTFQVKSGGTNLFIPSTIPTTSAGSSLGNITVQILDANGVVERPDNSTQVQLSLDNNPGGAALLDSKGNPVTAVTATAKNGLVTFSGLSLTKSGIGYTFSAQAVNNTTLHPGISSAFNIIAGTPTKLGFMIQPTYSDTNFPINTYNGVGYHTWNGVVVQVLDQCKRTAVPAPGAGRDLPAVRPALGCPCGSAPAPPYLELTLNP
jgi:hypothetical protein